MSFFLYNQNLAHHFGLFLQETIRTENWQEASAAIAWVRRSGTRHVLPSLTEFLGRGGVARFTVGVDIENTSREGLQDLLSLEEIGDSETFVYHNEDQSVTFHPKVYLFTNPTDARLIVGSNNLTEAGLFSNTEAGLQIDTPANSEIITEAQAMLAAWRDTESGFTRRLDVNLLRDLSRLGYVQTEQTLRQRRQASQRAHPATAREKLFRGQRIPIPHPAAQPRQLNVPGRVLLMRVRRASETARRTQIQLPIRLTRTQFFEGVTALTSTHDGRRHGINQARARGTVNTMKVEIPEIDAMADPVLRLERFDGEIHYQAHDAGSPVGQLIMTALRHGLLDGSTHLTIPNTERATWWRSV